MTCEPSSSVIECVRLRRPVIHNDYASLPHRKGMPVGHADVVRELVVPTIRNDRVVSVLGVGNKLLDYTEDDVERVSYIADLVWKIVMQNRADEEIRRLNSQLENLAMTDGLTGMANRRYFFIKGDEEITRVRRYPTSLALLMLDIDKFKLINDTYGHAAGDTVLQNIAKTILETIRAVDVAARTGGEEFAVLLPNTKVEEAVLLAERLRLAIESESGSIQNRKMGVTVSIGVAAYSPEIQNLEELLQNADVAMHQAKHLGRNRVVLQGT